MKKPSKPLLMMLFHWSKKRLPLRTAYIFLVTLWIAFEKFHLEWDFSWPWLNLGNVFSEDVQWIQWYEFTGSFGGSLWILTINIGLYEVLKNYPVSLKNTVWLKKMSPWLICIAIPIVISLILFERENNLIPNTEVLLLQPNIDPYFEKFDDLTSMQQLEKFIELAESKLDSSTNYLIGPETAIVDMVLENKIENSPEIQRLIQLTEKYPQLNIILGAVTYKAYSKNDKIPKTARQSEGSDTYHDVFNSAIQINTSEISVYNKSKLVQGVEFTPFPALLENLEFLAIDLGGITGSLGTQDYREVFDSKLAQMAPIICYESIFGEFVSH